LALRDGGRGGGYDAAMNVLVVGASGRTGRLLAAGALERGHAVTALVRARERLGDLAARVRVVEGDVLDGGVVSDAVDGQDAVLVALGVAMKKDDPAVNALGTLNAIRSMQRYGVRRLVVLSAGGTQQGHDPNLPGVFERIVKPLFLKHAFADLRRMETSVRQSELDWTIVRASGGLTDGPARGGYRVEPGYSLPSGRRITRADVAEYMLDQLTLRGDLGHAVAIAF
jgi:putative NADH-flavin reductase